MEEAFEILFTKEKQLGNLFYTDDKCKEILNIKKEKKSISNLESVTKNKNSVLESYIDLFYNFLENNENYILCQCDSCETLLIPFLIRKDLADKTFIKHHMYCENNNLYFDSYKGQKINIIRKNFKYKMLKIVEYNVENNENNLQR